MSFHLANIAVAEDKARAVLLLTDVDAGRSELRLVALDDASCPVLATRTVNSVVKVMWGQAGRVFYIVKESNKWDSPVRKVEIDTEDLSELGASPLQMEFFDQSAAISPDQEHLALSSFRDKKVHVFRAETFDKVAELPIECSFFANGLSFGADSKRLGFIVFDQGGGWAVVGEASGAGFMAKPPFATEQIRDDYSMSGAITFDGSNPVVITCYAGSDYNVVKYGDDRSVMWKAFFKSAVGNSGMDDEEYDNLMWNNQKRACVVDGAIYVGANASVVALDAQSGAEKGRLKVDELFHIHQLVHLPSTASVLCVDVFGNCRQVGLLSLQ